MGGVARFAGFWFIFTASPRPFHLLTTPRPLGCVGLVYWSPVLLGYVVGRLARRFRSLSLWLAGWRSLARIDTPRAVVGWAYFF